MSEVGARDRAAFDADGVACIRGLVDRRWVDYLREAVDEAIAEPSAHATNMAARYKCEGTFHVEVNLWKREKFFRFLAESPVARAAAELLASSEIRLYNDRLLVKEPRCGAPTEWHQDLPYFHLDGEQTCAAWLSLDSVRRDSGAVQYIRGSHRWGRMYFAPGLDDAQARHPDFAGDVAEIERGLAGHDVISFDLEPGDCLFHHCLVLHGAGGNADPQARRRGYAMRFAGAEAKWKQRAYSRSTFPVSLRDGERLSGEPFPLLFAA
jgi:ectoine hydroxylase-related dioxygenase (phytanoyl-CoA dioxygenase family)